jgi:two-component system, chemotaxis family, chemotaxis protein CheY
MLPSNKPKTNSRPHVLVIDDSEIARSYMVGLLGDADFVVFEQPSAIGATRAIRENAIQAVVVDVSMPGLSGDKLVGVLRKNQRLDGLVIVVVTGKTSDEVSDLAELEAADEVLFKDGLNETLVRTLGRLLRASSYRPNSENTSSAPAEIARTSASYRRQR